MDFKVPISGINGSKLQLHSHAQAGQDLFVIALTGGKKNKSFLEIGAGDPFYGSNTRLLEKMFDYSEKYILIGEYFNRTPVMIEYQGEKDRLFKRDFGKLFMEKFPVRLVDYGFLWGHLFDRAGFDDITYWLFEKK